MDTNTNTRLNESFIDLLEQLNVIMLKQGEVFRAKAYQKAQETIMEYNNDIFDCNQLKNLPGIGPTIMEKFNEYVTTGTLKVIEREKNNPANLLTEIHGIGPKKANELVKAGISNIEELRIKQDELLNATQKIGLKYYDEISKRIPRSEIKEYENIFLQTVKNNELNMHMQIVGSYRRGLESSGDIDVIITSNDKDNDIYNKFIDSLLKDGIILEVLSRGSNKCLVITRLNKDSLARRVDFLFTPLQEFPFAILYFTGSKIFNTLMRHKALKKGFTFNEHGMYKLDDKNKKGQHVSHHFSDEKSIFDFLQLEYKEPWERIDGRSVEEKVIEEKVIKEIKVEEKVIEVEEIKEINTIVIIKNKNKTLKNNTFKQEELTKLIQSFKQIGIIVLEHLTEKQLNDIIKYTNKLYHNHANDIVESKFILTDNEYDIIKEFLKEKYPNSLILQETGAPIAIEKNKVTLPYEMPSMDKIKPDSGALESWTKKYNGPYQISCKLDGVSGLFVLDLENGTSKLYTRGDGKNGQDISHFIPYFNLQNINININNNNIDYKQIVIRGEFIIAKADFDTHLKSNYSNPRNLVAGIINQKKIDENIKYVNFVAYELIKPELKPSEQFAFLQNLNLNVNLINLIDLINLEVVLNKTINATDLTNELLSNELLEHRKSYKYEIDGIIVTDDKLYARQSGNPSHSFAFKMIISDQIAEAKVLDILWSPSKDGYLKPRVRIEPVKLGGVNIEYITGNNALFIETNKIGIGALVQIIRSGDVIPKIISVTVPADIVKMPNVPYKWNNSHVDVLLEEGDINSDFTVKEKNITGFFRAINVDGLSSGNITRIMNAGYDTVAKIVNMSKEDYLKIDGFKDKLTDKIYLGIKDRLEQSSLKDLMVGSNIFGRGFSEKKIEIILNEIPDILVVDLTKEEKVSRVKDIKGMALKSAEAFVQKIDDFNIFLEEIGIGLHDKLNKSTNDNSNSNSNSNMSNIDSPLYSKKIVLTGSRDKSIIDFIKSVGGELVSSVNKNTFLVIAKTLDEDTGKANDARKLNIPIITISEFQNKYMI